MQEKFMKHTTPYPRQLMMSSERQKKPKKRLKRSKATSTDGSRPECCTTRNVHAQSTWMMVRVRTRAKEPTIIFISGLVTSLVVALLSGSYFRLCHLPCYMTPCFSGPLERERERCYRLKISRRSTRCPPISPPTLPGALP